MNLNEAMAALEASGTEQTRKTYRRHGVSEPLFGVKHGDLEKLRKQIKQDQALADALWATGNADARVLATKISAPATFGLARALAWVADARDKMTISALGELVSRTPVAAEAVTRWLAAGEPTVRTAGWNLLAHLAQSGTLAPDELQSYVPRIEAEIHRMPDAERNAMNMALIAIGGRGGELAEMAIAAARRIGKVEVDHGDTACKTPDAEAYINKVLAHQASKATKTPAKAR